MMLRFKNFGSTLNMSDVGLESLPPYSLVADEDIKNPPPPPPKKKKKKKKKEKKRKKTKQNKNNNK